LQEIHPLLLQTLERRQLLSEDLLAEVTATGSLQTIAGIPADLKTLFVTSHDIAPETHVRMQAAFQCHTDNAVSKTVNLPATATPEDVEGVILLAHELNCKGITVFRDRCKSSQVLSLGVPTYGETIPGSDRLLAGLEFSGECRNCTV
jgi:ribonucleoside-diphosphate reductase alpha chain